MPEADFNYTDLERITESPAYRDSFMLYLMGKIFQLHYGDNLKQFYQDRRNNAGKFAEASPHLTGTIENAVEYARQIGITSEEITKIKQEAFKDASKTNPGQERIAHSAEEVNSALEDINEQKNR